MMFPDLCLGLKDANHGIDVSSTVQRLKAQLGV